MMPRVKMKTIEEIKAFESDILGLVDMYAAAGVDLIELNVEREDEYGPQSLENRARIVTDLVSAIKTAHPEIAVQVLFNGVEENWSS